jgi:general stress protein 26
MLDEIVIPQAILAKKVPGYQMPQDTTNLLSWEFVSAHMAAACHYWLTTISAQGRPHTVPVWGLWYKNRLHFEGSMQTAWARHLVRNPHITVHLPNPEQVIIIEGTAHIIEDDAIDSTEWERLDTRFQSKYQVEKGSPYWYVEPRKVLAWDGGGLQTMTRWLFSTP